MKNPFATGVVVPITSALLRTFAVAEPDKVAASFLVELGKGESIVFDLGTGASRRAGNRPHGRLAEKSRSRGDDSAAHAADRLKWIH
jgi:hypothetical protein